jgi:hypothetical protein
MLIMELDFWEIVEAKAIFLTNATLLTWYNKKVARVKIIIQDSLKDHLIPHIVGRTSYEMYATLAYFY